MVDYVLEEKKEEARNVALNKIAYRLRTKKEIIDILNKKKFSEDIIIDTIKFLEEYDYINDLNYVKAYYRDAKLKLKGNNRIINELKLKGLKENDIRNVIDDFLNEEDSNIKSETEYAKEIADKMIKEQLSSNKELDDKFKGKLFRRLISKGYDNDTIYKIIRDVK